MSVFVLFIAFALGALHCSAADVHKQGRLEIYEYDSVDFDEGFRLAIVTLDGDGTESHQHAGDKGIDFWYQPADGRHYLSPQHGARLAKGELTEAGFAGCAAAHYTKGRLRLDGSPGGTHICVRTNAGRFSEMRIENFAVKSPGFSADSVTFAFSYITWEK